MCTIFIQYLKGKLLDLLHDEMTAYGENIHCILVSYQNVSFAVRCTQTRTNRRTAVYLYGLCNEIVSAQQRNDGHIKSIMSYVYTSIFCYIYSRNGVFDCFFWSTFDCTTKTKIYLKGDSCNTNIKLRDLAKGDDICLFLHGCLAHLVTNIAAFIDRYIATYYDDEHGIITLLLSALRKSAQFACMLISYRNGTLDTKANHPYGPKGWMPFFRDCRWLWQNRIAITNCMKDDNITHFLSVEVVKAVLEGDIFRKCIEFMSYYTVLYEILAVCSRMFFISVSIKTICFYKNYMFFVVCVCSKKVDVLSHDLF